MKILNGYKEFISRGNVIDLAVALSVDRLAHFPGEVGDRVDRWGRSGARIAEAPLEGVRPQAAGERGHRPHPVPALQGAVVEVGPALGEPLGDELWSAAAEQGWFLIGLPESAGGVGYSIIEESLVMRELGTACAPGPFLATVLAAHVAALAGNAELTAAIGAGSHRVALAERLDPERFAVQDLPGASLVLVVDGAGIRVVDAAHVSASTRTAPSRALATPTASRVWPRREHCTCHW